MLVKVRIVTVLKKAGQYFLTFANFTDSPQMLSVQWFV